MKLGLLLAIFAVAACGADLRQSDFTDPTGWTKWSQRAETAPRIWVDGTSSRGVLAISGASNSAAYGGWERSVPVEPGKWYRFSAVYRAAGLTFERGQVIARLDWQSAAGKRVGQPDYAWQTMRAGQLTRISAQAPAPDKAASVKVQLYLAHAPQATIWWDEVNLEAVSSPSPRNVTIAAINLRPKSDPRPVAAFAEAVRKSVQKADLIVLPEGITVVGTGKTYIDVAEALPGAATAVLSELAREKNAWVAAGIYERDGHAVYNTSVLIDRKGRLAGKYRKVYLPREEIEGGITPGTDYPVFQTDFGTVGMMICWDVQYADPARALALRGAEIVILPIWGGNQTLAKARAIENQVFIASSGYDFPTQVIDPNGEIVAIAKENGSAAITTIDLNRRYVDPWLGDMRGRFMKELRLDVPLEP